MSRENSTNHPTAMNERKAEWEMNQFHLHSPWKYKCINKLNTEKSGGSAGQHQTSLVQISFVLISFNPI